MATTGFFSPTSRSSLYIYLTFRFLQVTSCSIAGFIFCYLIWQHNNHYCAQSRYGKDCSFWQQREAVVPTVYIWLLTTIIAGIISGWVLSYRQISFFLDRLENLDSPFPARAIRLPAPEPDAPLETEPREKEMPITIWLRNLPYSVPQTALVIDASILTVFFFSWNEYSQHMILGPVIPFCYIWGSTGQGNDNYWKGLRVIDKECILSQCSWTTCLFSMGFIAMIAALEAYYVRKELEEKSVVQGIDDGLEVIVGGDEK